MLPEIGGWKDQPASVIAFFNLVMNVEGLIYGQARARAKGMKKGRS